MPKNRQASWPWYLGVRCLISAVRCPIRIKSKSKSSTGPGIPDCGSRRWREPVVFSRHSPWLLHDFSMCSLHLDMSITRRQAMSTLPGCSSCVCGTCSTCRLGPGPFPSCSIMFHHVPSCSIMFHPPCFLMQQRSWSNLRGGPDPLASRWPKRSPGGFRWKIQGILKQNSILSTPCRRTSPHQWGSKGETNKRSEMKRNQGVEMDYK